MKGTPVFPMCGFSASTVQILSNLGIKFNTNDGVFEAVNNISFKIVADYELNYKVYISKQLAKKVNIIVVLLLSFDNHCT